MKQSVFVLWLLLPMGGFSQSTARLERQPLPKGDYTTYHRIVCEAEQFIANRQYEEALSAYRRLVDNYDFVFLREHKLATQLALQTGKTAEAFIYLKRGIAGGWTMKSIQKNPFLGKFRDYPEWQEVKNQYTQLSEQYQKKINPAVRDAVKGLFKKDQRKALRALFTFGLKGQERYAETKFAPHSEKQLATLTQLIDTYGYPGEQLIGNNYWASVIISHHNSISKPYAEKDTLYPSLRPTLLKAIQRGQLSPYEFALLDNWSISIKTGQKGYGYLTNRLTAAERTQADQLRRAVGLSDVETINRLIEMHQQTGINPYLPARPDRSSGKITVAD